MYSFLKNINIFFYESLCSIHTYKVKTFVNNLLLICCELKKMPAFLTSSKIKRGKKICGFSDRDACEQVN